MSESITDLIMRGADRDEILAASTADTLQRHPAVLPFLDDKWPTA